MNNKTRMIFVSVVVVLLIVAFFVGATYAYFTISVVGTGNNDIGGTAYEFDVSVNVNADKVSNLLIPFDDSENNIKRAISKDNPCVDVKGYDICNLYNISIVNNGNTNEELYGYIETVNSSYITNNLKYQVFSYNDGVYTEVSDVMTIDNDSLSKVYFYKDNIRVKSSVSVNDTNKYYLVIWISAVDEKQDDEGKVFFGKIGFESIRGNVTANFSV